jgi:S1-C subfamily serine protease
VGGDIIIGIDGQPVEDYQALTVYLETETNIGEVVELTVLRDGRELVLPLTLEEEPRQDD